MTMFCKKCGKEIPAGNMFCNYCGTRADLNDRDFSSQNTTNSFGKSDERDGNVGFGFSEDVVSAKNNQNLKIGLIAIGIIILICIIINLLGNHRTEDNTETENTEMESTDGSNISSSENLSEPSGNHSIEYDPHGGPLRLRESGHHFENSIAFSFDVEKVSVEKDYDHTYVYVYCWVTNTSDKTCEYSPVLSVDLENNGDISSCGYSEHIGMNLEPGETIVDKLYFYFDEDADTDIDNMTISTDFSSLKLSYDGE